MRGERFSRRFRPCSVPLKEEQELLVQLRAGDETAARTGDFCADNQVLVFAGTDAHGNVTRIISPVAPLRWFARS